MTAGCGAARSRDFEQRRKQLTLCSVVVLLVDQGVEGQLAWANMLEAYGVAHSAGPRSVCSPAGPKP